MKAATCADQADRASVFERMAAKASYWLGTTAAFLLAIVCMLVWLCSGPLFGFSDTWQLVVNTATSIITFVMVFLIQRSQNREMLAMKIQIGELIASLREASNDVIDLDHLSEKELARLHRGYQLLSRQAEGAPPPEGR